jgi:S1-C subfamily serine protease
MKITVVRIVSFLFALFASISCCQVQLEGLQQQVNRLQKNDESVRHNQWLQHNLRATVALIDLVDVDDATSFECSGVFIDSTTILTAAHCVTDEETLSTIPVVIYKYDDWRKSPSSIKDVKRTDAATAFIYYPDVSNPISYNDIAILKVNKKDASKYWVNVAEKNLNAGDKVYSIGMPLGHPWIFANGMISQIFYMNNYKTHYYVNIYVASGSSGGPLFNINGELVGITNSLLVSAGGYDSDLAIYLHTDRVRQYAALSKFL